MLVSEFALRGGVLPTLDLLEHLVVLDQALIDNRAEVCSSGLIPSFLHRFCNFGHTHGFAFENLGECLRQIRLIARALAPRDRSYPPAPHTIDEAAKIIEARIERIELGNQPCAALL